MARSRSNLAGLDMLLGVTGGIAAYKAVDLAGKLTAAGAKVNCIMTENAQKLICPKSFEVITNRQVFTDLWNTPADYKIGHINLAQQADIIVIAPATANIIAKIANGICDDLLSTTLCTCWNKPVLLAPAMNNNMWNNPVVQKNVEAVKKMKFQLTGPETGRLACGTEGIGRMAEPADIIKALEKTASQIDRL